MNLNEQPVAWSHPYEYGGFRLWHQLGERDGEAALFVQRWNLTYRKHMESCAGLGLARKITDPRSAQRMIDAFGRDDFIKWGTGEVVTFSQVMPLKDLQPAMASWGTAPSEIHEYYESWKDREVDPTVRVPEQMSLWLDVGLALLVLLGAGISCWLIRPQIRIDVHRVDG